MRIAVVNDVQTGMDVIVRIISDSPHKIAWCACDGMDALKMCALDPPDIILMDLFVPEMNGVETIRQIVNNHQCPILIVTSSIEEHSDVVFEAMGAGAIDVVTMPAQYGDGYLLSSAALLRKIELIGMLTLQYEGIEGKPALYRVSDQKPHLVVIGSSSGGPGALSNLLSAIPKGFHCPIVVIQHVDALFAPALAKWLNEKTQLSVDIARDGDYPQSGRVYIAASNEHLVMNSNRRLYYSAEPRETSYRPSVDVFFNSVADHWGDVVTAVILTGMGRDGAHGLLKLRELGAHTIAEDESTAAVFGMPKFAAELGAAQEILPINQIPNVLCKIQNCEFTMVAK